MTYLLDGNVLVALTMPDHVHHDAAVAWWSETEQRFATCPVTQGTLLRLVLRHGGSRSEAVQLLHGVTGHPRHEFWPDELAYDDVDMTSVLGHRQVTDAYLAQLARHRHGRLATFDRGLTAAGADIVALVPVARET